MNRPAAAPDPPEPTRAAVDAAAAADVVIHELHRLDQLQAASRLFTEIWRPGEGSPPPVGVELLRALAHTDNYVAGAFRGPRLVGASVAFFTGGREPALHSHITGVAPGGQHGGVGFALKVHQRAWAAARGLRRIGWTFDPLVARNAWFNLAKLAAVPDAYLEDFYGPMTDRINAGMASDRLWLWWGLDRPEVAAACAGRPHQPAAAGAEALLAVGRDLEPVRRDSDAPVVTVAVPAEVEALDPDRRRAWRGALRETLGPALAAGARVRGFLRDPASYLVERG